MPDLDRITRNPEVMGGKACVRGIRVTVGTVVGLVAAGHSFSRNSGCLSLFGGRRHSAGFGVRGLASGRDRSAAAGRMKILVDMNLSPFWVPFLARHGFEAWHWSTVGRPSAPDAEILAFARINNFVILTHDLDFGMLLAAQPTRGPSVIQVANGHRRNGRPRNSSGGVPVAERRPRYSRSGQAADSDASDLNGLRILIVFGAAAGAGGWARGGFALHFGHVYALVPVS